MIKISVIIPMYNVENYIEKCVNSILNQEFQEFEIILIDDGSTDRSLQIAKEYEKEYPETFVVLSQTNQGQGAARNRGIEIARGSVIMFIDSDDWIDKDLFKSIVDAFDTNNVELVIFDAKKIDEANNYVGLLKGCNSNETYMNLDMFPELLFEAPCPWNKAIRKEVFQKFHLKFPEKTWYEDLVFSSKLYTMVDNIMYFKTSSYNYLQRSSSVMHSDTYEKNIKIIQMVEEVNAYYREKGLYDRYQTELEYLAVYHILIATIARVITNCFSRDQFMPFVNYINITFPKWKYNKYLKKLTYIQKLKLFLIRIKAFGILKFLYKLKK